MAGSLERDQSSESDPIGPLESQHLAGFRRRRNLMAEFFEDAPDLENLLAVRGGQHSPAYVEAVFETDANAPAEHRSLGAEGHLMPARRQHRPTIVVAEQFVGGPFHEEKVVHVGAD